MIQISYYFLIFAYNLYFLFFYFHLIYLFRFCLEKVCHQIKIVILLVRTIVNKPIKYLKANFL